MTDTFRLATRWINAELAVVDLRGRGSAGSDLAAAAREAHRCRTEFEASNSGSSIEQVFRRLAATSTETAVVLVLAAAALCRETEKGLEAIDPSSRLAATRRLVYGEHISRLAHRELGPSSRLRRLGIVMDDGNIAPQVIDALLGHVVSDSRRRSEHAFCGDQRAVDLVSSHVSRGDRVVIVHGPPASGRRTLIENVTREKVVQHCDGVRLAQSGPRLGEHLRDLALECRLTGAVPLLCNLDALTAEQLAIVSADFAPLVDGTILVTCGPEVPRVGWGRPVVIVDIGQPTHAQRAQLWAQAVGADAAEAERLAAAYPLAPGLIVRAGEAARARAVDAMPPADDVRAGMRAVLDDRLGAWARRLDVRQRWEDVVLPEDQREAIAELVARVRGRHRVYEQWGFGAKVGKGLGVSALFSGPPGTGKTMVAGLVARELGLEVYQVDMAKVVSKFIGETEKNLGAVFDAAEAGHAVLLFDEADGLFGKRTEVKSSNDRYANFETNYLLQRLESFTGVCVLTTNHEAAIDAAFQRRLSLHLRFEVPDEEERARLWRAVLPAAAPVSESIDFRGLARRYEMSGGYIKNAALRAAFVAADRGDAIGTTHLERAARVEYEGMGKL